MLDICGIALDKEATTKRFFDICDFYSIKNKDLKKLFNVSDTTVSYWRNGSRFPDWNKLMIFAYTVGLPLDVMIIGKKILNDEKFIRAVKNISLLIEKKYIEENKSKNETQFILNIEKEQHCNQQEDSIKKKFKNNKIKENNKEHTYLNFTNSLSLYSYKNGQEKKILDEYNNPLNGCHLDINAYDNEGKIIILRYRNGFLDGDEYDKYGNFLGSKPAVETTGHIEFWRKGTLHRDGDEAAVITNGFRTYEYWKNGKRIK